jgi:endonuclease/exonuclease/phosphatase family metal-dependent hydrolase
LGALLAINTAYLGPGQTPSSGRTSHPAVLPESDESGIELTVMTYNIWLGQAYKGFWRFRKAKDVAERIRRIAKFIKEYEPDLVCLQEVAMESGPNSIDQTPLIAETAGMHAWAFGEAFNNGLPFYRMIGGNAILSRWPLAAVANQSMAGRSPFYEFWVGNQRTLWCKTRIGEHEVLLASVHLTSHKDKLTPIQVQQILDFVGDQPAIIAGDFNASPNKAAIQRIIDRGTFQARLSGIDYIFVPKGWELIEHQVIENDLSDHPLVLSTYHIPLTDKSDFSD